MTGVQTCALPIYNQISFEEYKKAKIDDIEETCYFINKHLGHEEEMEEPLEFMKVTAIKAIAQIGL